MHNFELLYFCSNNTFFVSSIKYSVVIYSFFSGVSIYSPTTLYVLFPIFTCFKIKSFNSFLSSLLPFSSSSFISFTMLFKCVLMSTFANSCMNFELFQIIFPSVSIITSGNGEFINVLLAAVSTVSVKSFICAESSAFLLLLVQYAYIIINAYPIIPGVIKRTSYMHNVIINIAIITKYIFVFDTSLSKIFLLLLLDINFSLFFIISQYLFYSFLGLLSN